MPPQSFVDYEIHKIIINLIKNKFTGSITMTPDGRKLFFEKGSLVYAHSDLSEESFSAILCEMGVLSSDELEEIKSKLTPGQSLGKKIRELGLADAQSLAMALKQQIMRIVNKTVNMNKGEYQVAANDLPARIPKLKIRTLPLFVKSFLMIENPTFPEGIDGDLVFERTESFDALVDELNLPANYFEALDLMGSARTLEEIDDATELDFYQIKRLAYSLSLLKMGVLREGQPGRQKAPLFVAPSLPIEAKPLENGGQEKPDSASEAESENDKDTMPGGQVVSVEPIEEEEDASEAAPPSQSRPIQSERPRPEDPGEGPLVVDEVIPLDRSIDEPLADLTALADIIAQKPTEAAAETEDEPRAGSEAESPPSEPAEEAAEPAEDPVEALNRALTQTERMSPAERGFEVPEFEDDNETVPGSPVPGMVEDKMPEFGSKSPDSDLSDYDPGDVFAEDGAMTAPVAEADLPDMAPPSAQPPPVEPDRAAADTLKDKGFILPDQGGEEERPPARSRNYWKWLPVCVVVLLAVGGFVFKDLWWPRVAPLIGLAGDESVIEVAEVEATRDDQTMQPDELTQPETSSGAQVAAQGEGMEPFGEAPLEPALEEESAQQSAMADEGPSESSKPVQEQGSEASERESATPAAVRADSEIVEEPEPAPEERPTVPSTTKRGTYEIMARKTLSALAGQSGKYSIAFVVACEVETLDHYFKGRSDPDLRLLPRKIKDRDCFIGIWGIFPSRAAAQNALPSVPEYLRETGERPWVLNLAQYL